MRHVLRYHVLRYVVVLVALLGGTAAVIPTVWATQPPATQALSPALPFTDVLSDVMSSTLGDATETLSYWTPARMRAAKPASAQWLERQDDTPPLLDLEPGRDRSGALDSPLGSMLPPAATETAASSWSGGGAVTRTTGKVFFTLNGSDFVCSGSAVDSANRDTVLTAGHCVNSGPGEFASQWVFVPGYHDGERPYGTWTARRLLAPAAWTERGDIDHDVGFAVVSAHDGVHLTDVVGGQPIAFDAARGLATYSFGYPALGQYDGNHLVYCRGRVRKDDYGSHDQGLGCDMTDGSSGGPWLSNFDSTTGTGVLTSVNSFGYDGMPDVMWGPYLDRRIQNVFAKAQAS